MDACGDDGAYPEVIAAVEVPEGKSLSVWYWTAHVMSGEWTGGETYVSVSRISMLVE